MPIDYKDSLNKLNQLLAESQGKPVSIESIVETLVTEDVDEELISLVKLALDSKEDHIGIREIVEGVFNLFNWREENC